MYLGLISWRQLFACDSCQADSTVLAYCVLSLELEVTSCTGFFF